MTEKSGRERKRKSRRRWGLFRSKRERIWENEIHVWSWEKLKRPQTYALHHLPHYHFLHHDGNSSNSSNSSVCVCFLSFNCSLSLSLILSFYQHFLKMFSFAHVLLSPLFFPFQTSGCFTSFLFSPSLLCVFVQSANTTWLNRLAVRCNCVTMVTRGPLFHFDNHCSLEFPWHPTLLSLSRLLIFSLGCFSPSAPQAFLEFLKKMSTPYGSDDYTLLYHTHTHFFFSPPHHPHIISVVCCCLLQSVWVCVMCVC